jgi:hypothetical protein
VMRKAPCRVLLTAPPEDVAAAVSGEPTDGGGQDS